jgi:hypothetical protein
MSKSKKVKKNIELDLDKLIWISKKDNNGYRETWVYHPLVDGDISQYINHPDFTVSN